jgi:centromeric protein E
VGEVTGSGGKQQFTYDHVFGDQQDTATLYEEVLADVVKSTVNGFNGTIFAYGQTSSGKTHTMMGSKRGPGVLPLATRHIFNLVKEQSDREFFFRLSYVEIYNEVITIAWTRRSDVLLYDRCPLYGALQVINDLLDPTKSGLQLRMDDSSNVKIIGVTEKVVTSPTEVMSTIAAGEVHRQTGDTAMNLKSSRCVRASRHLCRQHTTHNDTRQVAHDVPADD